MGGAADWDKHYLRRHRVKKKIIKEAQLGKKVGPSGTKTKTDEVVKSTPKKKRPETTKLSDSSPRTSGGGRFGKNQKYITAGGEFCFATTSLLRFRRLRGSKAK